MSLRIRLTLTVVLAALLPTAAVGLWARSTIQTRATAEYAQRLEAAVARARAAVDARLAQDRRAVDRLCDGDYVVDRVVIELEADRFGPERQADLGASLPRIMRSLGTRTLELLTPDGEVLASAHYPGHAGARDPELAAAALAAGDRPFVRTVRLRDDSRRDAPPTDERALLVACVAGRGRGQVVVVAGRLLDAPFATDLLGDDGPVSLALVAATSVNAMPAAASHRDVITFHDASGTPALRLEAVLDDGPLREQLAELERVVWLTMGTAALVAVLLGVLLALGITRPLARLEAAAERVAAGDLESTVGGSGRGEVGRALAAFDHMTRELATTQRRLLRAERIAAWREIARRIAHEIKNPLLPIQVSIETMRKTYAKRHPDFPEIFEESTVMILEEVKRLEHIVTEFSRFARLPRPRPEPLDVREVMAHLETMHVTNDVPLHVFAPRELPIVRADREQLTQVLVNLVQNAADAARARHGGGEHTAARVDVVLAATKDCGVDIRIRDNGPGIPAGEERQRVFEPYYTTKAGGTGLGLAIVHRILSEHLATIEIGDSPPLLDNDVSGDTHGGAEMHVVLTKQGPPLDPEASLSGGVMRTHE